MKTKYPSSNRGRMPAAERGVALVITLILLAVITFMVITLLVVSRTQKGNVSVTADQTTSGLAADEGFGQATIAILSPMIAFTNPYISDIIVSTNYIHPPGFIANGAARTSLTNVNYYYANGQPLNLNDSLQNLLNLLYLPRAPVFMTNRIAANSNDFRYYLDLNRNGRFEMTGLGPVIGLNGTYFDTNGNPVTVLGGPGVVSNYFTGDPQWIGIPERPGFPHSPTNRFIARYAYLVLPISKTMDINYIHNYAKRLYGNAMPDAKDCFFRNMGVGTWEINLAAFLADLNTNLWAAGQPPYVYNWTPNFFGNNNVGVAFDDAESVVKYRYFNSLQNLLPVFGLFGNRGVSVFDSDFVDGYTHGPAMTGTRWLVPLDQDTSLSTKAGWSGADNTNHFFTTQDLFDRSKFPSAGASNIVDRLMFAATRTNSYDAYTLYRLLAQLGTESAPEVGKINLNFMNVDNFGNVVPNLATRFLSWTNAAQFLTNVTVRLLTNAGYAIGPNTSPTNIVVTNGLGVASMQIQIWPTNFYTPSVHRMLQLAANIYDASGNRTNRNGTGLPLPTVFRPIFSQDKQKRVFIIGYQEVTDTSILNVSAWHDLNDPRAPQPKGFGPLDMVYGIPLIIGAKKGLPNFNEFAMHTTLSVTRKLEFRAQTPRDPKAVRPFETNQMYVVTISNVFGIEGWNSYSNSFPDNLQMLVAADMTARVTNELGQVINPLAGTGFTTNFGFVTNITANAWNGFFDANHAGGSFIVPFSPLNSHFLFMTNSTYRQSLKQFVTLSGVFERGVSPPFQLPHWWLDLHTRLRFILVDTSANRIVDYVNLSTADDPIDIDYELMRDGQCPGPNDAYNPPSPAPDGALWCTNRANPTAPTYGIRSQIRVCLGPTLQGGLDTAWNSSVSDFPRGLDKDASIDFFRTNLLGWKAINSSSQIFVTNVFYAPFNPTRTMHILTSWQANDPLVHYTIGDLTDAQNTNRVEFIPSFAEAKISNIGRINQRYEPWGGNGSGQSSSPTSTALQVKDPLVMRSDDWDFPVNKFPNIGWLGRVHRGTPWQTVYLKSAPIDVTNWMKWTGNTRAVTNFGQINTNMYPIPVAVTFPVTNWTYDVLFTFPTNDWGILDLFTTAYNDNATRGKMSINQTNLASWSAVMSGVIALRADTNGNMAVHGTNFAPFAIDPVLTSGNASPLLQMVNAINEMRRTNYGGSFRKLGDILSVPEFTVNSPFLNLTNLNATQKTWGLSDAVVERLPQQTLGLLGLDQSPRFLVYSWGQALKPANKSIVTSGPFFNLCTNYQVTAESATRTVLRVDGLNDKPPNPRVVVEKFNVLPPD